ncbi:pyridoxal phosphate-dependent aminotransferase [Paenarthrobacter sp. NPDC091711]|uniref:pyridoxal phosphate-dependent aminotransferase n=1 Tax=Paenarthrobacter sp. NPDC091711 TaxID=3364385 RepID=UPI0037F3AB8C
MTTYRLNEVTAVGSDAAERIAKASRRPSSLGATPTGAIALSMGEPDSGTPDRIVEAAVEALRNGRTRYTKLTGAPELQSALAVKMSAKAERVVSPDQIVITHGGSAGLAATILAVINPGDRVLIPEPTYSLYADHLAMAGAEAVWIPNKPDGSLDLRRIQAESAVARMIILCNPGNPSGRIYGVEELRSLAGIMEANPHMLLLSDEAYSDIVFDGAKFLSVLELEAIADQVILCSTFSKTYAMTGWRLGYVVAPAVLADKINLVHRSINGALNTFVQDAALEALETDPATLEKLALSYQLRRDIVVDLLSGEPGISLLTPQGAFYAWVRIDSSLSSDEMTARFAEGGVIVRSGSEYGPSGEGYIRISFATDSDSLKEGLRRFVDVVRSLV